MSRVYGGDPSVLSDRAVDTGQHTEGVEILIANEEMENYQEGQSCAIEAQKIMDEQGKATYYSVRAMKIKNETNTYTPS